MKQKYITTFQLKLKANRSAALNGRAHCLTISAGRAYTTFYKKTKANTGTKTEMVSDTFNLQDSPHKRNVKRNTEL